MTSYDAIPHKDVYSWGSVDIDPKLRSQSLQIRQKADANKHFQAKPTKN